MARTENFTLHMCYHTVQYVKKVTWHKIPQEEDLDIIKYNTCPFLGWPLHFLNVIFGKQSAEISSLMSLCLLHCTTRILERIWRIMQCWDITPPLSCVVLVLQCRIVSSQLPYLMTTVYFEVVAVFIFAYDRHHHCCYFTMHNQDMH